MLSLVVNYCDDIREEVGNKTSLIGTYGTELIVPKIPTVLPKLCMYVQILSGPGEPFPDEIVLKVLLDEVVIAEQALPPLPAPPADKLVHFKCQFVMSPFVIANECKLRVRAYFDNEEVKGPALSIRAAHQRQPS